MEQFRTRKVRKRQNDSIKKIIIGISVLVVVVIFGAWLVLRNIATGGAVFTSTVELPFYNKDSYLSNSKYIAYKKGNEISVIDPKGKGVFTINSVNNDAKMVLSENYLAYFEKNKYYVYNMKGKEISRYETDDTIYDIRISDGYIAMVKADQSGNTYVVLNDFEKGQLFSTPVDNANLLDFGVVHTSATVWTLTVNTSIPTPLCVFTAYNSNKSSVSSVINISEQLVEKVIINSDKVYAIGTSNLVIYDIGGKKEQTYLTYGWKVTDWLYVGAKPYFVLVPRTDDPGITSVRIRHSDATEYTFTLQEECKEVIIGNNMLYAFNENFVFYTDLKGENIKKAETPFKINSCESVLGGTHIIADNGSKYVLLSLK